MADGKYLHRDILTGQWSLEDTPPPGELLATRYNVQQHPLFSDRLELRDSSKLAVGAPDLELHRDILGHWELHPPSTGHGYGSYGYGGYSPRSYREQRFVPVLVALMVFAVGGIFWSLVAANATAIDWSVLATGTVWVRIGVLFGAGFIVTVIVSVRAWPRLRSDRWRESLLFVPPAVAVIATFVAHGVQHQVNEPGSINGWTVIVFPAAYVLFALLIVASGGPRSNGDAGRGSWQ